MMPRMDGIEATRIIRGLGYKNPVVALTANAIAGQSEIFLAKGFDGYISKPIDMRELDVILNRYIRDKQDAEVIDDANQKAKNRISGFFPGSNQIAPMYSELMAGVVEDIENALVVLVDIILKFENLSDEDYKLFTVTVHGVKSALSNIGEVALSNAAYKFELAGKNREIAVISSGLPVFIDDLRELIDRLT